jgi:hypothetical protein
MNTVKRGLDVPTAGLLTRVNLSFVSEYFSIWLRFGYPDHYKERDHFRRWAMFTPGAKFCRVYWDANAYGLKRWQLLVLQAGGPGEAMQKLVGIYPAIHVLLRANGERQVKLVLGQMSAIEALGSDLASVSSTYWRVAQNRLAARLPLPDFTVRRPPIHSTVADLR